MENVSNNKKKEHKIVKSLRAAGYLMWHGCHLIKTEVSEKNLYHSVFVFYDDEKTNYWLDEYIKYKEAERNGEQKDLYFGDNKGHLQKMER